MPTLDVWITRFRSGRTIRNFPTDSVVGLAADYQVDSCRGCSFCGGVCAALLPTKLVLSDEGLIQKQLLSELRLKWTDIAEWRYFRVQDVEGFWIRDKAGKQHDLKRWLVFGMRRSKLVAEILRQKGVVGREEYDA
jgi:hypothetical protein